MELIEQIQEELKEEELRSYIVSPLLKTLASKNEEKASSNNKDELVEAYAIYVFIAETYTRMVRMSIAGIYNYKALGVAKRLYQQYNFGFSNISEVFRNTLRDRNFYVDDDCLDVLSLVKEAGFIEEDKVNTIYNSRMKRRRGLKNDPIEMSEEYLSVIDEVEEKIANNRTIYGMGACHEVWALKEQYLLEKGIVWKSPARLNPGVMFD